ncbi:TPA: hypothetical protein ACS7XC_001532 [Providencia alcalifaciens]
MKFLEEFWDAVKGNTIARVRDPIIGTFIVSWLICNWYEVTLLFFGNGKVWERIDRLNLYLTEDFGNNCIQILMLPIIITVFYLFIFPRVSLKVKKLQKKTNDELYYQAFEITKSKAEKNVELNMELLKSDPNKEFLSELAKTDIAQKKADYDLKLLQIEKDRIDNQLNQEKLKQITIETKEKELNEITKQNNYELEKEKYDIISAQNKAAIASARFPIAYSLLSSISKGFEKEKYFFPFEIYGEIIAYLFGYKSFSFLLDDKNFNNITVHNVKYIYLDYKYLSDFLITISDESIMKLVGIDDDDLFEIITNVLQEYNIKLINREIASEIANELFESEEYSLANRIDISAILSDNNMIDPDFHIDEISNVFLSNERLIINTKVIISGTHRLDDDFYIPPLIINLDIYPCNGW